jgi:hypothetical protein
LSAASVYLVMAYVSNLFLTLLHGIALPVL